MIRTRTLKVLSLFKMKKAFLLLIFLISAAVGAQKTADRTIYLDSAFHETSQDKHVYYRVVSNYYKKQPTYLMVDYYKSGSIYAQRHSTTNTHLKATGTETRYHENGKTKSVINYEDDIRIGVFKSWHANGNPEIEGKYDLIPNPTNSLKKNLSGESINSGLPAGSEPLPAKTATRKFTTETIAMKVKLKTASKTAFGPDMTMSSRILMLSSIERETVFGRKPRQDCKRRIYRSIEEAPDFPGGLSAFYQYVMKKFPRA